MITIEIKNIGGIFYVNNKRLGYDFLTPLELSILNEFFKELKDIEAENKTLKIKL